MSNYHNILIIDTNEQNSFKLSFYKKNEELITRSYNTRAQELQRSIEEFLKKEKTSLDDLEAIGFIRGTGSLTGLRIGAVTANTLAWLLQIPIIDTGNSAENLVSKLNQSNSLTIVEQLSHID